MTEMVERVRDAILAEMHPISHPNTDVASKWARAAIEAMREPTEAMSEAIGLQAHKPTGWHSVYPNMWRAGIDAALADYPCPSPHKRIE